MAINFTALSMHTASVPPDIGMQVAVVHRLDAGTVQLVVNAQNGSVTMELDPEDAAGLAKELAAHARHEH